MSPSCKVTMGIAWLAIVVLAACSFDEVELEGRPCPCAPGWVCVADVCVREEEAPEDGGPTDAGGEPDLGPDSGVEVDGGADGGPGDGGPEDSGLADMGPPPSICESATTALFCDGFEDGLFGPWSYDGFQGTGTVTTSGDRTFRGMSALDAQTTEPSSRAWVGKTFTGLTSGIVSVRAWVYVPSTSGHTTLSYLLIGDTDGTATPLAALQIRPAGDSAVYLGPPTRRRATGASGEPFPLDQWVCTTLTVAVGTDSPSVYATVDGAVAADESPVDRIVDEVEYVIAGIEFTNAESTGAQLYMDEVVVDDEPLTCP